MSYLPALTLRLATGIATLPDDVRARHARYLKAAQRDDGGFAGREGDSDLYYTSFGLRGLAVLGELRGEPAQQAAEFLQRRLLGRESIVDFLSLLYSGQLLDWSAGIDIFSAAPATWRDAVSDAMETLRRPDGGYAKGNEGAASSTYHTFLVLLCRELLERPAVEPLRIVDFLRSQQSDDGGFLEIRTQKRAGVNPTAAAVASLRILNQLDEPTRLDTIDFLAELQSDEGGMLANTRIPIADLLSTFTGLLTMLDLGGVDQLDIRTMRRFVQSLEIESGGFHGAAWDEASDVEYTFYGLGCRGLLAALND